MSDHFNTMLIVGGTSGIGEAFAKRFQAEGKKVIVTGRNESKLEELKAEGIAGYVLDMTKLEAIPQHVQSLFEAHPEIDTVWINGGIQRNSSIAKPETSSDEDYIDEITVNLTAPLIFARHVVPKLLARSGPTTFMITSSGLGFGPIPLFPVYCSTKSAVHSYLVALRQQLQGTSVRIIEIVPPYISTGLDRSYRQQLSGKLPPPMPMEDFIKEIMGQLKDGGDKELKEVAGGSAVARVGYWRESIGAYLQKVGLNG